MKHLNPLKPAKAVRVPGVLAMLISVVFVMTLEGTAADGSGVPKMMAARFAGKARDEARRKMGGKEKAEKSVLAALRWLKANQNEDGSWSDKNRSSITGFALLCFLGHGELTDSPEFGATVKKGLEWVRLKGTEFDGNLSLRRGKDFTGNDPVYEHAIATYAVCEYYAMTKDVGYAELIKAAIAYIVEGQAKDGGWQYSYTKGPNSDTSVSGWQIQALNAAHLTGLEIPGVREALDLAMLNLKRVQDKDGCFGYRQSGDRDYALDGVGALCTYLWKGDDRDRSAYKGISHLLRRVDKDRPVKYKGQYCSLYTWYYNTQACLHYAGSASGGLFWRKWNAWMQDEVSDNQDPDGSWPRTGAISGFRENEDGPLGNVTARRCAP